MKSMKLASGFAVSALALAIAGQTVAQEATTDVSFSGALEVRTVLDLEGETRQHEMRNTDDWYQLYMTTTVTHGPFSGDILVGWEEDGTPNANQAGVEVDNLRVDEGPISFGDIGRITDTAGLYEDITEASALWDDGDEDTRLGVDAAFRYTVADLGVRVQAEGTAGEEDFGFAAAVNQDLDVAEVWADAQIRQRSADVDADANTPDEMTDFGNTFGVGAVVAPVDMVSLTAVLRSINTVTDTNDTDVERTAYALRADLTLSDTLSAYGLYFDTGKDNNTDTAAMKVGATAEVAPLTIEGSYEAVMAEVADALIAGKVTYTDGAYSVFGEVNYSMENFAATGDGDEDGVGTTSEGGTKIVVGGDYTTDSGIVYGAEYENGTDGFWDNGGNAVSQALAYARYSF